MNSDVDIAQAHTLQPITDIAAQAGFPADSVIDYGGTKAKLDLHQLDFSRPNGKLVLVTGVTPTPSGEGKSTVLIGLADAIKNSIVAIREPSLGPVMGMKGGAAGGGYSQIVPMEEINLHFTGDFHAIAAANNTLAALIDNHIHQGNELGIQRVTWQRCVDVNDRALRPDFTITAASEIMAVLCLSTSLHDLKQRLGDIVIGSNGAGDPITARDLKADGAMAALLRDAINPNLVQTLGGTPALCHGGPFANIAHGCNSLIATTTALKYADVVLTEAGFGSDLGAEKFFDIKTRGVDVAAAVIVATIRSVKHQGGFENLQRHVENVRKFGVTPVVALNLFAADTEEERAEFKKWAEDFGVDYAEAEVWAKGGKGAAELASVVEKVLGTGSHPLYDPADGIEHSIETVAKEIYHAADVEYSEEALATLEEIKRNGWDTLPVCISKTQYSFSDNAELLGAPEGFTLHVRELKPRLGAGFVVALTGKVLTMPGLPKKPAAENITVSDDGVISGLF